jgi:hypothetical protein
MPFETPGADGENEKNKKRIMVGGVPMADAFKAAMKKQRASADSGKGKGRITSGGVPISEVFEAAKQEQESSRKLVADPTDPLFRIGEALELVRVTLEPLSVARVAQKIKEFEGIRHDMQMRAYQSSEPPSGQDRRDFTRITMQIKEMEKIYEAKRGEAK